MISADKIERIDIKEFRKKGYLQELNRRFLHPLGLALEVVVDKDGAESLGGVWDYRKDPTRIYYAISGSNEERTKSFKDNKQFIDNEMRLGLDSRMEILGFGIEPI